MTVTEELPSQASRAEAVAEAGMGADNNPSTGLPSSNHPTDLEKVGNGEPVSPSGSSGGHEINNEKATPPTEEPQRSKSKTALIMLALCIAVFLAALDTVSLDISVPTIATRFHASEADYTWIGSAYLLAAAASTPTWGKFSDIWGRKPILLVANIVFLVGSLIAALSINIKMLLAGRAIQGIGGGGLIILANICISDLFSMRDRGKYFGMIGGVWGLASALGPILGGVFTEKVSWRWCFYINLPFDGIAFAIIMFFLDIETPKTDLLAGLKAIDWLGSITIVAGTIMFLLGLEYGGVSHPWTSAIVICLIIFGLFTIVLFFLNEWKLAIYPVMPLRLFKYRSNIAALVVCFCHGTTFISGAYFLPLYFQAVLGASPILSGVYTFPFVLSLSFVSAAVGVFIKKTGQYLPPIWFGMFFMTLGFGLYIDLPSTPSWSRIIVFQIIAGIGVGPNFQAPLIALQTLVKPRDIATATATFGFTRNIATSISVVIGGVIFQNGMSRRQSTLAAGLPPDVADFLGGGSAGAATDVVKNLPAAEKKVANQVYTESLKTICSSSAAQILSSQQQPRYNAVPPPNNRPASHSNPQPFNYQHNQQPYNQQPLPQNRPPPPMPQPVQQLNSQYPPRPSQPNPPNKPYQYAGSPPPQNYGFGPPPQHHGRSPPPSRPPQTPAPSSQSNQDASLFPLFKAVDKTGTGQLTEKELRAALVNGDFTSFDPHTVKMMIRMFDVDKSGTIGFDEFWYVKARLANDLTNVLAVVNILHSGLWGFLAAWRSLFDRFDEDRSGYISYEEYTNALVAFGYRLSSTFVTLLYQTYEKNGNNMMSFDLFVQSCIVLKRMTDVFKKYDDDRDGYITMSFEEFLTGPCIGL
ncbi:MAG: hypothetical protein LQ350_007270 [Teloschistes chrysophthalmus]|nr:MAG: hypothetical protein LQ350_007270 [Niorma chrysophthalma]